MKNFTKKLALLLVFAMVLGVVAPGNVAKAAAETRKVVIDFSTLTFQLKAENGSGAAQSDFEFTQFVGNTAPTAEDIKKIKDKDWVEVNAETSVTVGDISWFNKKKASYVLIRKYENGAYTYICSDKIDAAEEAFKVLYTQEAEGKGDTKTPKYTSAQSIGTKATGYFVFYTGKGTTMKVLTPDAIGFRVDGTYIRYESVKLHSDTSSSSNFITTVKRMIAKGGTLLFVQNKYGYNENNYHSDRTGWPSIKEVKYKIAAQKAAPTVKVGIDHVVPLKAGQEYRVINAADTAQKSPWVDVEKAHAKADKNGRLKVGKILIEDLVVSGGSLDASRWVDADGTLNAARLADGEVKLQVRTAATAKGVASKIYSVIVSQTAVGTVASTAALNVTTGVDMAVSYKVAYDETKGITIKNNAAESVVYEYCFTASGASVTGDTKWKQLKGTKSADVKDITDYTAIHVRKVGDKKNGILSSNYYTLQLSGLVKTAQTITPVANGTLEGVSGSAVVVTTAGAVTVTIPKAAVSDGAIENKTVEVTVSGVTNPGTLKYQPKGTGKGFNIKTAPTFASNKVTFKIDKVEKGTTGDSGDYVCQVEGLKFTFKVVIGN